MTTEALWIFRPVPPDCICATSALPAGALSNSSMISCRLCGLTEPVIGSMQLSPNKAATFATVSRKNEKISTLRSSALASSISSSILFALEDCDRSSTFHDTLRAAMKFCSPIAS